MSENNPIQPEMIVDFKSYKWILSSCFQKSLRRGRFDLAEPYLKFLWEHDRNYITYRFGTILAEDVGIANLPLVNEYLETNLAKKKIDEAGGLDFLISITKRACESVKDRSSCDAANIGYYYSFSLPENSNEENKEYLKSVVQDSSASYIDRIHASWILLGNKKFPHDNLPFLAEYSLDEKGEKIDDLEQYLTNVSNMNLSPDIIDVTKNSYATQRENIFLGIPIIDSLFLAQKANDSQNGKIKVGDTIENTYVKETTFFHKGTGLELISSGIDGHTREGKAAYYKFLKGNSEFMQYMKKMKVPFDQYMLVFSHCMFRTEGHEVNKRLYFPTAVQVMRDCEQKILNIKLGMGENYVDFNTIKKCIIADMPLINSYREEQIKNMEVPMIAKVEPKVKKNKKTL